MGRSIPAALARLPRAVLLAGAISAALAVPGSALAYERYSEDRDATNCRACHGDFRSSPYVSLSDGQSWGDDLHDVHRNTMLGGDCDVCHDSGPRFPVLIEVSAGGNGLAAISCVGCHGRSEGGNPTGRGLRQHHWRAGETGCVSCHSDANPSNATAVGEDILPPYYASPGNGHANMPTDSCNPAPGFPEDFAATTLGLDNDGDLSYDGADTDCVAAVCGNGQLESGEECDDGNILDGDCCSSICAFEPTGSSCDDGLFCNVGETCDGAGACGGGGAPDCDDGVGCTVDSCNEGADACVNAPDDAACDDGVFCNGVETCDAALDCQAGTTVDCDDADICTDDACNESAQGCDNVFDPTNDPSCQAICPDDDEDGFSPAGGVCGAVDCDDNDDAVNPGAAEICDDDNDNDCDGLVDAADDACAVDGQWTVRSGPLEDPAYAGSSACAGCHEDHFEGWIDSLHARILIRPGDAQAAGFPLPPGGAQSWNDVLFVVGQKWKTLYVDRNGSLQDAQWNYLLGQLEGFGSPGDYDCGACHTTGYDPDATFLDDQGAAVAGIVGSWVEYNVGCEACHGPGAAHAAGPSRENINLITFEWYDPDNDGTPDPVDIRSSVVCGNCHYRNDHQQIQNDRRNNEQYNDWLVSGHASSLEPTTISTYCAKCHSPGNAEFFAAEHNFTYFEPDAATHVACISCHDPHRNSHPRWADLEFPSGGRQDPRDYPATLARYRGTDGNVATRDYDDFEPGDTNALCQDCHRQIVGFRRHIEASPDEEIVLEPPFAFGESFVVPHREHIEDGNADCVDCHMHYSRESINPWDVRTHSLLPNEWEADPTFSLPHYSDTCGQCHPEAQDCDWCHVAFGNAEDEPRAAPRRRDRDPGEAPREDRRRRLRSR